MKSIFKSLLLIITISCTTIYASPSARGRQYFQLTVYHISNQQQEASIDSFLQMQYMPAMHQQGVKNIGVFKPVSNDTAVDKKVYVFTPFESMKQWEKVTAATDEVATQATNSGYVSASYKLPPFARMEKILLKAFEMMPFASPSKLSGTVNERVYELRSYESPTEKYFRNKVQMFNQGGEVEIFSRLGFNAIFYSEVVFGSRMPNLMYMTSFDSMAARDEHWKAFGNDAAWKKLSAMPEYQNNVAHIDITFLHATSYSDL